MFLALKKLQWPSIVVRAINSAIPTMDKIVEKFKTDLKGYKVKQDVSEDLFEGKEKCTIKTYTLTFEKVHIIQA